MAKHVRFLTTTQESTVTLHQSNDGFHPIKFTDDTVQSILIIIQIMPGDKAELSQ